MDRCEGRLALGSFRSNRVVENPSCPLSLDKMLAGLGISSLRRGV